MDALLDPHGPRAGFGQQPDRAQDVADRALREEDDRAVHDDVGVGPVDHEEIGEAGRRHAQVGARVAGPHVVQFPAAAPGDLQAREKLRGGEAGAVDQHVGLVLDPVGGDHALGCDPGDRLSDQLDVRTLQRAEPDAVVQHRALAAQRIGRNHVGQQVRPVGDLGGQRRGGHLAQPQIGLAHRGRRAVPAGIGLDHRQEALGRRPEQPEPVPLVVIGHVVQQPFHALGDILVVVRHRQAPGRAALEHREVRGLGRDLRHELIGRGAGADHRHALAAQVDVVTPFCGMERRPLEGPDPLDLRDPRLVELADRAHDGIGLDGLLGAILPADFDTPDGAGLIPAQALDPGLETDVLLQAVLGRNAAEVFQQLRLRREVLRPAMVRLEGIAVHVVGIVDPAAGIGVDQPGAAHVGVGLDDLERHARLAQANAGQQARHPRPDHQHLQPARGLLQLRLFELRVLAALAGDGQLVGQEVGVFLRHRHAADEVHHPPKRGEVRRGGLHDAVGQILLDRAPGLGADLVLNLRRQSGIAARERHIGGCPFRPDPCRIARDVHQGGQQRRQMCGFKRPVELSARRIEGISHGRFPLYYRCSSS